MNWEVDVERKLRSAYPEFGSTTLPTPYGFVNLEARFHRAWRGELRPLHRTAEVSQILADLHNGQRVNILPGGVLEHDPGCHRMHEPLSCAERLTNMNQAFDIVLVDCGPVTHPQVFSIRPAISGVRYPGHPHLRRNQVVLVDHHVLHGLCPYSPSDGVYARDEDALVRVLDYTSIFLAHHIVWVKTAAIRDGRTGLELLALSDELGAMLSGGTTRSTSIAGYWGGEEAPHDAPTLLKEVGGLTECCCGSGRPYADCHRSMDTRVAAQLHRRIADTLYASQLKDAA